MLVYTCWPVEFIGPNGMYNWTGEGWMDNGNCFAVGLLILTERRTRLTRTGKAFNSTMHCFLFGSTLYLSLYVFLVASSHMSSLQDSKVQCSVRRFPVQKYTRPAPILYMHRKTSSRNTEVNAVWLPDSQTATSVSQCWPWYPGGHEHV